MNVRLRDLLVINFFLLYASNIFDKTLCSADLVHCCCLALFKRISPYYVVSACAVEVMRVAFLPGG